MRYHFTQKSSNAKTGAIPVTTSSRATCPDTCGYKGAGCYAENFPLRLHWDKVTRGERGDTWADFLDKIRALPAGQLWRHNQAGDLEPLGASPEINRRKLAQLIVANIGRRGFTYTHHAPTDNNRAGIESANAAGFTINWSADNLQHADTLANRRCWPIAAVLPADQNQNTVTPQGRRVVVCPATQRDDVTCASCQLCARADRKVIIGFPAHGARKCAASTVALTIN